MKSLFRGIAILILSTTLITILAIITTAIVINTK